MTNQELAQKINQWMARIRVMRPSVEEAGTIALPLAAIVNEMADVRDELNNQETEEKTDA